MINIPVIHPKQNIQYHIPARPPMTDAIEQIVAKNIASFTAPKQSGMRRISGGIGKKLASVNEMIPSQILAVFLGKTKSPVIGFSNRIVHERNYL